MAGFFWLAVAWTASAAGGAEAVLAVGAAAPDFRLPGVDGRDYSLADFQDQPILVVVFTCNHCPTAQAYEDRLIGLYRDFAARGVAFVAISPNDPLAVRLDELGYTDLSDSLAEMKIRAKDKAFPFPYLYDGETQRTAHAFGVLATPHVYVFDRQRRLRYVGRIDKSEQGKVDSPDARNALEALLEGRPVPVPKTRVIGCSTKWSDKRVSAQQALAQWDREPVALQPADAARIRAVAENKTDKYRLVNVWATWCGPCVIELPELVTINRMYRRRPFELITINMDKAERTEQALKTLQEKHVSCRNLQFASGDVDALAELLDPEWEGPLPYTILIAPGGKVVYRRQGPLDPLELKRSIVDRLGRTY